LEIAKERKWVEEKQTGGTGSGTVTITPGKNGALSMVPPHLQDKIGSKIATSK